MLTLLASIAYLLLVLVSAFLNIDTFFPYHVGKVLFHHPSQQLRPLINLLEIHVSLRAEIPLHLLLLKCLVLGLVDLLGGFDYQFTRLTFYLLDIPNLLASLYMFWEMIQEKSIFVDCLHINLRYTTSLIFPVFNSMKWILRLLNPIWRPQNVSVFSNITYATEEELKEYDDFDKERLQLDVYTKSNQPSFRPVLVHIHGGGWQQGTKNLFYPFENILVTEEDWVVVNITYRLAPKHPYPAHLYDVKRALRWVKQSIHSYGGDPNFIVLSGDSSGAHLAAMVAGTENETEWQPGFESVDTSIRGVISLNGILDIQSDQTRMEYFTHKVALQNSIDAEFLERHSPLQLMKQQRIIVPFLVITGERDQMVNSSIGANFKAAIDLGTCTLLVIPGAHHVWYILWSLRSLYGARVIQAWCRQLYTNSHSTAVKQ